MTTIAADREAGVMAADSKMNDGDVAFPCQKLYRIHGAIVGIAGEGEAMGRFLRWFTEGEKSAPPQNQDGGNFTALVLRAGRMYTYIDSYWPEEVRRSQHAIGTGAGAALAAMHLGCEPEKAVEVAVLFDANSRLPVDVMRVEKGKRGR